MVIRRASGVIHKKPVYQGRNGSDIITMNGLIFGALKAAWMLIVIYFFKSIGAIYTYIRCRFFCIHTKAKITGLDDIKITWYDKKQSKITAKSFVYDVEIENVDKNLKYEESVSPDEEYNYDAGTILDVYYNPRRDVDNIKRCDFVETDFKGGLKYFLILSVIILAISALIMFT